eukprot:Em0011g1099a
MPSEIVNSNTTISEPDFSNLLNLYDDDLPFSRGLDSEMDMWKIKWTKMPSGANELDTPEKVLRHTDKDFYPNIHALLVIITTLPVTSCECQSIIWNGQVVRNNSLVTLSVVQNRFSSSAPPYYPLLCQGITGGQWYEPSGVLFTLTLYQLLEVWVNKMCQSRAVSWNSSCLPTWCSMLYQYHHHSLCWNDSDLTLAQSPSVSLPTSNGYNYGLTVAATYGPNITGGVQFQLLTPTNVDPPVFQLTCTSTSSPPTDVLWTTNGSPVSNTSSQIVTDRPTSTYNNTLTVTGRAYGMYTCTVTTTCSPVCGGPGFTLNPRSTTSSLTVKAPPGPPTGVTAVQSGPTSVSVSWTAPTSGGPVTKYDIYYVTNGGPSTNGSSTTSTSYNLTNLQVGVQYNISVIAVGTSLPSQSANVTRTLIPLNITKVTSTSITVMWSQPGGQIGITYTLSYTYQGPCAGAGGGGNVSIGHATQYTITGLQEFSAYILTITASIGVGSSPPASVLVNTSLAAPSAPPNNLTEATKTSSSVTISWGEVPCQDQNSVIVEYSVLYGAVTSGVGGTVATPGRTLTVNGLSPYTNYSIEVSAVNSDGTVRPYSSPLFVVTGKYKLVNLKEVSPTSAAGGAAIGGAVGGMVGGVVLVLIAATVVVVIVILLRRKGQDATSSVTNTSAFEKVKKTTSHTLEMDSIDTGKTEEVQYATISGEPARQAPSIKEFPPDSDVVDGEEEVVFNVRVTGYPRPSFTWYRNGTKMTTDHSFTLGEDGSLVIHTAEMGHAGVYELEVANELGVDRRRVSLGVYGIPLAKFGPYVAKSHEKNNTGFNNQYREDGKVKCQQYWVESGHQKYGPFSVAITEQKDFADYVIRVLEVALSGSAARKVTQFHFTGWPDHGVPEYATSLLAFHRKVKSQHDGSKGPILVHCSAGVGRTGTLIAIDTVLEQIEKEGLVDIAGTIRKMRRQRMKMVQTPVLEQVSPDPKSVRRDVALEEAGKNRSMDYLPRE